MRGHREEPPDALHAALQNSTAGFTNADLSMAWLNTGIPRSDTAITTSGMVHRLGPVGDINPCKAAESGTEPERDAQNRLQWPRHLPPPGSGRTDIRHRRQASGRLVALHRQRATTAHRLGQPLQYRDRSLPAQAAVGDALAIDQRAPVHRILAATDQVAFHHDADDPPLAAFQLRGDVLDHGRLVVRVLAA